MDIYIYIYTHTYIYTYIYIHIYIYHIQLAVKSSKISHLTDKRIGPGVEFTTAEAPAAGDEGRPDKAAADDEQAMIHLECLL